MGLLPSTKVNLALTIYRSVGGEGCRETSRYAIRPARPFPTVTPTVSEENNPIRRLGVLRT